MQHKPTPHSPVAIVIGAGIAGIASAIRLAAKGYSVALYETNAYPGGKLAQIQEKGYRFDAGPSLFTLPHLVTELFELAGQQPSAHFNYQKLDEICRYFWPDGQQFTAHAQPDIFAQQAGQAFGIAPATISQHLAKIAKNYTILDKLFLQKSLHQLSTWLSRSALSGYLNLGKLGIMGTMATANQHTFSNPKLVQLFNRYATYNGSDPYQAPATLNIIPHLEYNLGAYFPAGGMVAITNSLVALAQSMGVQLYYNSTVSQIHTAGRKVTGVTANGQFCPAKIVICNSDISLAYKYLLPQISAPKRLLSQAKSSSGIVFYWGIKSQFAQLGLHNIFFSNNYKAEFEHIFGHKAIYKDPTIYLNISSKLQPTDAPQGCENWFVLINVPANAGQNWSEAVEATRTVVLKKLSQTLGQDIGPLIAYEQVLDPIIIQNRTGSSQGALYGNSSNSKFAAFLRHPNFSRQLSNLYFVGGSVHPGGGIPLALSSAKIATNMIR
jgi:phytoene desaturase